MVLFQGGPLDGQEQEEEALTCECCGEFYDWIEPSDGSGIYRIEGSPGEGGIAVWEEAEPESDVYLWPAYGSVALSFGRLEAPIP